MKLRNILFLLLLSQNLFGVELKIRLFSTLNLSQATVAPDSGDYFLIALDSKLRPVDTILGIYDEEDYRNLHFLQSGSGVKVTRGDFPRGTYKALLIKSKDPYKEFSIQAGGKERVYHGDLRLRIYDGHLQVVNIVEMEQYVAGVVESEGGHKHSPEFFKAQAVLARTFALKNLQKHSNEGYNLKDDVTSQVYFSKARHAHSKAIIEAVEATRDTILVTYRCEPILGVFHANSGGYCTNAEDVWLRPVEYLKARPDSFSVGVGSYSWEKELSKNEFYGFFARSLGVPNDIFLQKALLNFDQDQREAYFTFKGKTLKLTKVRNQFGLRSTFFDVEDNGGSTVKLKGNGYGHGVGLSQDGAIEMARRGYSYREILNYYYEGVELESITSISLSASNL